MHTATGRAAIVVEGGAMRGVFSAGVLDVFLEQRFDPFDLAIGVSAGACNLASHLAGQHGRNRRSYLDLMTRREFIDPRRALTGGSIVDLDWLWDTLARTEPLDVHAIARRNVEFLVAATSGETGEPVHLRPDPDVMFDALKASCALPLLYRRRVHVAGARLVDGGVSDPVPAELAHRLGATRILVVRSRPADYVKTDGWGARATAMLLRSEPALAAAIRRTADRYGRAVRFMKSPPPGCSVIQVAPDEPLATRRTTQDGRALAADYELGRAAGARAIERWAHETGAASRDEGRRGGLR